MSWKVGRVQIGKGCVGHARKSLNSLVSYLGTVSLLQTTMEVEDRDPQIAYKHMQLFFFFLLS